MQPPSPANALLPERAKRSRAARLPPPPPVPTQAFQPGQRVSLLVVAAAVERVERVARIEGAWLRFIGYGSRGRAKCWGRALNGGLNMHG